MAFLIFTQSQNGASTMKKLKLVFLICAIFTFVTSMFGQIPVPGSESKELVVLHGATIHLGNGEVIESGVIAFKNGVITHVGPLNSTEIPSDPNVKTIKMVGKHVYPGFINLNNTLGITEIDAVHASNDLEEIGSLNPNVRSMIAFNTESRIIPTVRSNGVLLTQPTPRGTLITGQSAMMKLDAWNWQDAVVKENDGIHLYWPAAYSRWSKKPSKSKDKRLKLLKTFFDDAKAYCMANDPKSPSNLKLESMRGVFDGTKRLYLHAELKQEILESISFCKNYEIPNVVITGGAESYTVIEELKAHNIPVILKRVHSLPEREDDDVLQPFKVAKILDENGIVYALSMEGDMEPMQSRNLPFLAGTTVAYGVDYENAVQSISLNAAKIVGIDNKYGSLEVNKSATLFVTDGDALDMRSNKVTIAYIDGNQIDLDNPQKVLYRKYSNKYGMNAVTE